MNDSSHTNPDAQPLVCAVDAGSKDIYTITVDRLRERGVVVDSDAAVVVLLDIPRGYALHVLEHPALGRSYIAVTDSPCVEYWEDLWELGPAGLLACAHLQLLAALRAVAEGQRYRMTPQVQTQLTPAQRRALRLLARGYSNQQIAQRLTMQRQTVKNTVAAIYDQLGLSNRNEAVLYYWGILQVTAQPNPADTPDE
jgi:DNA-binding NarL/FixJ family response regulator